MCERACALPGHAEHGSIHLPSSFSEWGRQPEPKVPELREGYVCECVCVCACVCVCVVCCVRVRVRVRMRVGARACVCVRAFAKLA